MDEVLLQRTRRRAHTDPALAVSPLGIFIGVVIALGLGALTVWAFSEIIASAAALHWIFRG